MHFQSIPKPYNTGNLLDMYIWLKGSGTIIFENMKNMYTFQKIDGMYDKMFHFYLKTSRYM